VRYEGECHNMVVVVENFLGVSPETARDIVADLMRTRMEQFEHLQAEGLPRLFEEFDLDEAARAVLRERAERLEHWTAGILEWHRRCVRYSAPYSWGPTGLGTTAARVSSLLR
jgi:germacradienol/geosmin synthase